MNYAAYPRLVVEDIARLRRQIAACGLPGKLTDYNLLIGTWNIRAFGSIYQSWEENRGSPKRNLRAMATIVEIVRRLDVIAIQEVKRDLGGLRLLLDWLGPDWGVIVSDVTPGEEGNAERLAFVFDRRRVQPSGLAGEIVLPPVAAGDPATQFARPPYVVGFQASGERFALLTAHVKYGQVPADRLGEVRALAEYVAREIRDRIDSPSYEENNLIVLGDFNIDKRGDDPLFQAFVSTGLVVPPQIEHLRTVLGREPKYYDQIAWFMGRMNLQYRERAGVVDFGPAVYPENNASQMSHRVSDHLPLWVEFVLDRSTAQMAATLGVDPNMPDPLRDVPDRPPR